MPERFWADFYALRAKCLTGRFERCFERLAFAFLGCIMKCSPAGLRGLASSPAELNEISFPAFPPLL